MNLHVDRLTLRSTGLSEGDARRLPRLVAERLAAVGVPGDATPRDRLRVSVTPHPGEAIESMAGRIASEILDALARSS
jgi:hypothetical protein